MVSELIIFTTGAASAAILWAIITYPLIRDAALEERGVPDTLPDEHKWRKLLEKKQ